MHDLTRLTFVSSLSEIHCCAAWRQELPDPCTEPLYVVSIYAYNYHDLHNPKYSELPGDGPLYMHPAG